MVVCIPGFRVPNFELNKNQLVFSLVYLWWCFWNHENSLLFNDNYNTLLLHIVVQDPPSWLHTELIELLSLYNLRTAQNLVFSIFHVFCEMLNSTCERELVVFEVKFLYNHNTWSKTLLHAFDTPQVVDDKRNRTWFKQELTSGWFLASKLSIVWSGSSYVKM